MSQGSKFVEMILKEAKINKLFIDLESISDDIKFLHAVKKIRKKHDCSYPEKYFQKSFESKTIEKNGYRYYYLKNNKIKADKILYYFHGGAYIKGLTKMSLSMIQYIARKSACDIMIADYPIAPESGYQEAINSSVTGYQLIVDEYAYQNIVLIGDSAGGGLALSLVIKLNEFKKRLPTQLILLSPWLDLSMTNSGIAKYEEKEYILSVKGLLKCAKYYADDLPLDNELISPINHIFEEIPSTYLFIGDHDIFYPDCIKFIEKLKENNQRIRLCFYKDMCHDWLLFPFLEEGKAARNQLVNIIKTISV